jgi:putative phage-type endonuclease
VNCSAQSDQNVFVLLGQKLSMRELPPIREELKREERMRKQAEMVQGTPEWHASRHCTIGATEAAGLVGTAFRDSKGLGEAQRLWKAKTGPLETGGFENENMRRGKALEPIARGRYESQMGWETAPMCVLHDDYDFVRASLDGLRTDDDLVLEIKCPGLPNHMKFQAIEEITHDPLERQRQFARDFNYYRMQILWQLMITGAKRCHFVSYNEEVPGIENRLALIELFPEPDMQQVLLERAIEFWSFVERREFPPPEWLRPCHFAPCNLLVP